MNKRLPITWIALLAVPGFSQVVTYEGDSFPEADGWTRSFYCTPERWLDDGWLYQFVEEDATECGKGDVGDADWYVQSVDAFKGIDRFFVEWRMEATGPNEEITANGPSGLSAGSGGGGVTYLWTISRDHVRVIRDNLLPFVWVDVEPGVPHTYRMDMINDVPQPTYSLYIDSIEVDAGIAEGEYPFFNPSITWMSRAWDFDNESRWDYVRYGRTPDAQSADYDSNSSVDSFDAYFIEECIERSATGEPAVPSCTWADVANSDNSVTCDDWHVIATTMWTGPGDPPEIAACPLDPIPAVSDWGMAVLGLLMLSLATVVYRNSLHLQHSFRRAG